MTYAAAGASAGMQGIGMIADLFKQDEAERNRGYGLEALQRNPELDLPDQNYSFLDYAGDYNPYAYAKPKDASYETISEDPRLRGTEMDALQRLVDQGSAVGQAKAEAAKYGALDEANQLARGREGAIRNRMAQAGQSGSGMDAIMQAQAAQSAANRARSGTMDAVHMAALEKLANEQAIMGAAGNVRGQDLNVASPNADIINKFNVFNTEAANRIAEMNTGQQNQAALRNLNTRQDISGRNTGIGNANVDRKTNNAKTKYDARTAKANSIANAYNGQAVQAQQTGDRYNQLGQQGSQLFTNIGSGITAEQAHQPPPPQSNIRITPTGDGEEGQPYDQLIYR